MAEEYTPQEVTSMMNLVDTYIRHRVTSNRGDRSYDHYHPSEWGKAQPYDSKIQTPYGPKMMKDIRIGDLICGPMGDIRKVIQVNPQGPREIYKVVFSDGDEVECCGEHLWEVNSDQLGFKKPKVMDTISLLNKYVLNQHRCWLSVRMPQPIFIFEHEHNQIISPYVMGVLLGDGCLRCKSVDFTSIDNEIIQRVKNELVEGYEVHSWKNEIQHRIKKYGQSSSPNIYKQELIKYGLSDLKSEKRFIPNDYLYSSINDRYEIIRGLMDTDGTIDHRGYARFSTKSKQMADNFKWLIESIGGTCVIRNKVSKSKNKEFHSFRCDICLNNSQDLFSLERKKIRGKKRQNSLKRFIKRIEAIGVKDCQCIAVDHEDGLYLTDNCIITHNCLRMQQYKHYAWKGLIDVVYEDPTSLKHRLFDKGHNMHHRWSKYFDEIGNVLMGGWKCKNILCYMFDDNGKINTSADVQQLYKKGKTRIYGYGKDVKPIFRPDKCICGCTDFEYVETMVSAPELNMRGHADLLINCENLIEDRFKGVTISYNKDFLPTGNSKVVGDMKTISSKRWKAQLIQKGPDKDYLVQLTIYVHILGADYGIIMYENKDTSEMKWYMVPRNDKWWEIIQWQAKRMIEMAKPDGNGRVKLPPPKYKTKKEYKCSWCEFKSLCHKSAIWESPNLERTRREFYKELL
jgi:hypothetical protein